MRDGEHSLAADLPPEEVEELGRGGGVGDMHVHTVSIGTALTAAALLQKAFKATGGMLGTSPIIAMGKEHHQTTL